MRGVVLVLGLCLLVALGALRLADPWPVQVLRETVFDTMQRMAPQTAPDQPLPVQRVHIDADALAAQGAWPWPRDVLARLVARLADLGAVAVVLDMPLSDPDRLSPARMADAFRGMGLLSPLASPARLAGLDSDLRLAEALRTAPVVLGLTPAAEGAPPPPPRATVALRGDAAAADLPVLPAAVTPLPLLEAAAAGLGVMALGPDAAPGDVVRRVPLLWRAPDGALVPAVSVEALRLALGRPEIVLDMPEPGTRGQALLRLGDLILPVTAEGEVWLRHAPDRAQPALAVSEVLAPGDGAALRPRIEGRIVLLGAPAAGPADLYRIAAGEPAARVAVHAAVIEQALSRDPLRRDGMADLAEVAAFGLAGLIVMVVMGLSGPGWSLMAGVVAGGTLGAASWYALTEGALLVDATFPLAGLAAVWAVLAAVRRAMPDRTAAGLRATFAEAVAPGALKRILAQRPPPDLGGVTRPVSVMVCDIRNFTPMTQGMTAPAVFDMVNGLFTTLGDEILAEGGTLDKVTGDAMMAFWNAPLDQPDHPLMAARAALRLRGALARLNARGGGAGQAGGQPHVSLAIGVASGMGWAGRMGLRGRQGYGVLGDAVAQATRVETACRHVGYDILLGAETARRARDLALLDAGSLHLRGVGRVEAAILVGAEPLAASTGFRDLEACHLSLMRAIREEDAPRIAARLGECRALASAVEPGLRGFYDRIERRFEDYR